MIKESKVNRAIMDLIIAHGGYVFKVIVANRAGVHDMIVCLYGRFCSLEGKRSSKEKMSMLQIAAKAEVIKAGGLSMRVDCLADVEQIIEWARTGYIQPIPEEEIPDINF